MRVKTLYREYDGLSNVVSGTIGLATLTGEGTEFTKIPAGTLLEVDGPGFIGKVLSVESDTSLTLDRALSSTFEKKKFFQDWTPWLISFNQLEEEAESDKPAEASVITFDSVSFEFYYVPSIMVNGVEVLNPVYAALETDIDSKRRCVLRFQAVKKDFFANPIPIITHDYKLLVDNLGNYISVNFKADQAYTRFEGMIDFESIEFPEVRYKSGEIIKRVTFDALDKFSAMSLLDSTSKQRELTSTLSRVIALPYKDKIVGWMLMDDATPAYIKEFGVFFSKSDYSQHSNLTETLYKIGDIIIHPDDVDKELEDQRIALVTESYLVTTASLIFHFTADPLGPSVTFRDVTYNKFKIFTFDTDFNNFIYNTSEGSAIVPKNYSHTQFVYYDRTYYGGEIGIIENIGGVDTLTNFNAISILYLFVKSVWGDVDLVNKIMSTGGTVLQNYPIPLYNFEKLIGPLPFDKEPADALVFLSNTLLSYVVFDSAGNLLIRNKDGFNFTDPSLDIELPVVVSKRSKRLFWDKLCDACEINVDSWIYDNVAGEYIKGKFAVKKKSNTKPRNSINKDLVIDLISLKKYGITVNKDGTLSDPELPDGTQEDILNRYAELKATEYFNFYGKRHVAYSISINNITWDMLGWELLNTFKYNGMRFFATRLSFDLAANTIDMEIVSIEGYDYNAGTVLIPQVDENYTSSSY
ncbi:MAG: hypothetical protein HF314_11980 [Ignavibacteria bacterium]|jgi:hypothetical protein|nr:hypothetical protein [Ignavibacteria bacterium]MCU7503789.1 hypothetical protein [Ignavibacteria bacterium]MCU7517197.1 hypothetical protein [Ignavibacteria bacterium]